MQIRETPKNVKMEEKKNSPKKHQKTQKKSEYCFVKPGSSA